MERPVLDKNIKRIKFMDKDKCNCDSSKKYIDTVTIGYNTVEKYKFSYYESEYEIDQFGRFIKNSSKNI